jgi:hypothetical protein
LIVFVVCNVYIVNVDSGQIIKTCRGMGFFDYCHISENGRMVLGVFPDVMYERCWIGILDLMNNELLPRIDIPSQAVLSVEFSEDLTSIIVVSRDSIRRVPIPFNEVVAKLPNDVIEAFIRPGCVILM